MVTLFRLLGHLLGRLPHALQAALGATLGWAAWVVVRRRRAIALKNLAVAFPDLGPDQVARLGRAHFGHMGRALVELLTLPALRDPDRRARKLTFVGFERLDRALAEGRGAMVLTAHLGNWELMTTIAARGYDFSALYKAQRNVWDRVLLDLRTQNGLKVFTSHDGLREMLKAAKRGALIGILADQGGVDEFPFFGQPAPFPLFAAAFAVRHSVAAFPVFGLRGADGRLTITVHDEVTVDRSLPRDQAERDFQRRYIAVLEAEVRRAPEQYLWVPDIWRHDKKS